MSYKSNKILDFRKTLIPHYGQKTNQHANYLLVLAGSAAYFFSRILEFEKPYRSIHFWLLVFALGLVIFWGFYLFCRLYMWGYYVDRTINLPIDQLQKMLKLFRSTSKDVTNLKDESIKTLFDFERALETEFSEHHKNLKIQKFRDIRDIWRKPCYFLAKQGIVFWGLTTVWVIVLVIRVWTL